MIDNRQPIHLAGVAELQLAPASPPVPGRPNPEPDLPGPAPDDEGDMPDEDGDAPILRS